MILEPEGSQFNVSVPALPEIATFGDSPEEALAMARDAIRLTLEYRRDNGLDIPSSDDATARVETVTVTLPAA